MAKDSTTIKTPRANSKTARARAMFAATTDLPRSAVIKRFEDEIGLTPKGASTYYQTMRKQNGLVHTGRKSDTPAA